MLKQHQGFFIYTVCKAIIFRIFFTVSDDVQEYVYSF